MVEISKHLFESTCRDVDCSMLLHPWDTNCFTSSTLAYMDSFIGSAKFYFIVHLAQNLMKGKKMLKRKELMKAGEHYMRSTILGGLISGSCVSIACLLRWLIGGKFTYYTYFFIPSTINGILILIEPPRRRTLVMNLFYNLVIEFWMNTLKRNGIIALTKSKQTFLFMVGSAVLFYLMRLEGDKSKRTPMLWLFTPEKVKRKTDDSKNVCPHEGPCLNYIAKGALSYFGIGFGFTIARKLLPRILTPLKAISTLKRKDLNMGLFFAGYIGIYKAVVCYLCNKRGYDSALYALPAGFLAGLSFLFKPSVGFAIASLTGAFKLFSTILYEKKILPTNIPLPLILYCFSQGLLFHSRYLHEDDCPQYIINLMKTVTNGRSEMIHKSLLETVRRLA